jgi:peptidyl-prolyl cis-trans isomerase C
MTTRLRTVALAATAALSLAACQKAANTTAPSTPTAEPPVGTVNGKPISAAIFNVVVQGQLNKKPSELTTEQRKQVLEQLVELYVAAQQAEKENVAADPEIGPRIELQDMNALAGALVQKHIKNEKPTDEQLKTEYERWIAQLPKTEYHARHILVKEEVQAKDVIAQLGKGAKFEDLAKKVSVDGSKSQGGDLNWFTPDRMVKPFSEAVEKLKKGEYTKEPVKSEFGWHVIRLEDSRATTPPPFDSIKDRLAPMVQQRQVKDYIESLRKSATIQGL